MNKQSWTKYWMVAVGVLAPLIVWAGLKVWSIGEVIQSADLNNNFAYLNSIKVGGAGNKLVNADVSSTAGISFSKLQTPQLIPKAWATTSAVATCDGADTTTNCMTAGSGIVSIKGAGSAGRYIATFTAAQNVPYVTVATPNVTGGAVGAVRYTSNSTTFNIVTVDSAGNPLNGNFSAIVMGN